MILSIFALSLDLLVGYTGLVSLGHAAYFGVAAYALALTAPASDAANLWLTLPLALAASALTALVIGALVVRTSGVYFIMLGREPSCRFDAILLSALDPRRIEWLVDVNL